MAKGPSTQAEVERVRQDLTEVHKHLGRLVHQVTEDHKKMRVCAGYQDFLKASPLAYYERAGGRLARKDYKIAFVGPFKAGKSTFLSALLQQPGMLPAEDAECTFAVCVIAAPGVGEEERVEVSYYNPDEALANMIAHTRYHKLYAWDEARLDKLKANLSEREAVAFFAESSDKAMGGEAGNEARELKDFLGSYEQYKDRLGRTHIDSVANLPKYVRKEEGIGHLLLIKLVKIFMNNPVLAKQGFSIADTPGTDSMNTAAKKITLDYLKEADAVIYLAEARGLSVNFEVIREELAKYHNSIREKMFIVANKADGYEVKSMIKVDGAKAPIEVVYDGIVDPLRAMGLDEEKLFFTCGRIAELELKKRSGEITPEEESQYSTMRKALDDKRKALAPDMNPLLLKRLISCFTDGAIDDFRRVLIDYLDIDIQVERLKEIFADLTVAHGAAKTLLDPERDRVRSARADMRTQGMVVTEFFEQMRDAFSDKISEISRVVESVAAKMMEKTKEQIRSSFGAAIDKFNIERIRVRMNVQIPMKIKLEVIENLKSMLAERFVQVVREAMSPLVKARLRQLVEETRIPDAIRAISSQLNSRHGFELEHILDEFDMTVDRFTTMRAGEETWELQSSETKPGSFDAQWTDQVEQAFREQLKKMFVERFTGYASKLCEVLGKHYQALLSELVRRFDRLTEDVSKDVKKDPDRVKLPTDILGGGSGETEEEKNARALVNYFEHMDALEGPYAAAASALQ